MMHPTLGSLLPHVWFAGLPMWLLVLIAVAALAVVIKGADWLVEGAAGVAKKLGMPEVVVGATIVSLGTTSPEMAVSVLAAFSGNAGLALGNGVGSIIADTGLIFGLGCVLAGWGAARASGASGASGVVGRGTEVPPPVVAVRGLPADRFVLNRQGWVQIGSAVLLAGLVYGSYAAHGGAAALTRPMGVLLVALLLAYLFISVRWARQHPVGEPHIVAEPTGEVHSSAALGTERKTEAMRHSLMFLVGMGVMGLALVILAGDGLVQSVTIVATQVGVPQAVIATTIVALGTSLPELVTGLTAIRKGHAELLVGNVIGADILNVLFVIGLSAVAAELPVIDTGAGFPGSHIFLLLSVPTMLAMLVLMRLYIFRAVKVGHFSRWMGVPLLVMYVAFLVASYAMST